MNCFRCSPDLSFPSAVSFSEFYSPGTSSYDSTKINGSAVWVFISAEISPPYSYLFLGVKDSYGNGGFCKAVTFALRFALLFPSLLKLGFMKISPPHANFFILPSVSFHSCVSLLTIMYDPRGGQSFQPLCITLRNKTC